MFIQDVTMEVAHPEETRLAAGSGAFALLRLARPHQWSKNLLLLAPLVFSRRLFVARYAVGNRPLVHVGPITFQRLIPEDSSGAFAGCISLRTGNLTGKF